MRNIIHHVNSKPEHIRHLVALGCTVVVGAVVIGFWFHSFQSTTYALLNPSQENTTQGPLFAASSDSLFGRIGSVFSDIKAQIGDLFGGQTSVQTQTSTQDGPVYPLPVSGNR